MLPDLSYIRVSGSGHIYIVRFCTTHAYVAARLCYVRSNKGSRWYANSRYRKIIYLRERVRRDYECISTFPGDHVYLIPAADIDHVVHPFAHAVNPLGLGQVEGRFLADLELNVSRWGGQLGVIGSTRLDIAVPGTSDIDLAISGPGAWKEIRTFLWTNTSEYGISYLDWRTYPADQYRARVLDLERFQMERIRAAQWWRHFRVGETLFSISYSRGASSAAINFGEAGDVASVVVEPPNRDAMPIAPYRLPVIAEGPMTPRGAATVCWFLRDGLPGNRVQVTGVVRSIDGERWVWAQNPACLTSVNWHDKSD
jgi:predicted nucleotidyltransferase